MLRTSLALFGLGVALAACDGGGNTGGAGGAGASGGAGGGGGTGGAAGGSGGAAGGTGGAAEMVPDPGNAPSGEWTDEEPNDSPGQATPMGVLEGPVWAGFVMPYTAINPDDDVDYFVFKTGDAASLANVYISLCWTFPGDLLDLRLYEVAGGVMGPLALEAATAATGCETLVDFGAGPTDLAANTTYVLEVAAAPGLALNGDPGLYSA